MPMKFTPGKKKKGFSPPQPLEVYLLAAENPIGRRQLRPIFRRKRNGEVLTREQVTAIKRGRRLLRREMKERGLKRRIDFEVTATNLGLFFDRNRLFWPFFLWLIRDNTVAKILATTAVLTTVVTVTEPVIEYVTQFVTQYITQYVTQYVDRIVTEYLEKDRFTISLSDEMMTKGLELSEDESFSDPKEVLTCAPSWDMPCISISQIPSSVMDFTGGKTDDIYFAYTFYCRYINLEAERALNSDQSLKNSVNDYGMEAIKPLLQDYTIDYEWGLLIGNESLDDEAVIPEDDPDLKVSDAIWVMVLEDDRVILCAKPREDGTTELLPTEQVLREKNIAYMDRSMDYINQGLANINPALNVDTVAHLEDIFDTDAEIAFYREEIDRYLDSAGLTDLTKLMLRTDNAAYTYQSVADRGSYSYYQLYPESFLDDEVVTRQHRTEVMPYLRPEQFAGDEEGLQEALNSQTSVHKYTVIVWLEGDDPECVNALMNGHISLNFQIKGDEEDFLSQIESNTDPTDPADPTESA